MTDKKKLEGKIIVGTNIIGTPDHPYKNEIDIGHCSYKDECEYKSKDGKQCFHEAVFYGNVGKLEHIFRDFRAIQLDLLCPGVIIRCGAGKAFKCDAKIPLEMRITEEQVGDKKVKVVNPSGFGAIVFKEVDPKEYAGYDIIEVTEYERDGRIYAVARRNKTCPKKLLEEDYIPLVE